MKRNPSTVLKTIGAEGVNSLKTNTPKNTGKTASGWTYDIKGNKTKAEVIWKNVAHPELDVNLAKLIDMGHGTRTGGYVPPRPYIKKAMSGVLKTAGDKIAKEMIK